MRNKILSCIALAIMLSSVPVQAQAPEDSLAEASFLLRQGEIQPAIDMLMRLEAKSPKDGNINMLLGDCYHAAHNSKEAIAAYLAAQKKGINEAWLSLASLAAEEYRLKDADGDIELYRKGLKKGRKTLPDESGEIVETIEKTRNMLTRVQQIVVIDSLNVPAEDFFEAYRLSPESGSLGSPDILPQGFGFAYPTVVYTTEDSQERLWAAPDSAQTFGIVSSTLLYDGTWDTPRAAGQILNEGGDANYPFLMPDGVTLYFANDGENSLGGYDIFISRRNGTEFLQPQNMGMPFNSPYNDYMLAIDEMTGVGWWATDRNHIPGHLTIYIFIPEEMRTNYSPDMENLADFAKLKSIRDTWREGEDYSAIRNKALDPLKGDAKVISPEFTLSVPGRGTLFYFSQLRNQESRKDMKTYLSLIADLDANNDSLTKLRDEYRNGKTSLAEPILKLESERDAIRKKILEVRNRIVRLEVNAY